MAQLSGQSAAAAAGPRTGYAILISAIAALGGLLFGYDTGVISGASLYLKSAFHLTAGSEELAVSAVLVGCIIGAIFGGRIADAMGRRGSLLLLAVIFLVGALLTSISPSLAWFIGFRILVGIATGAASFIAPMFIGEMAPPAMRGGLMAFSQLAITIGIAVSYWVDLGFAARGMGWRPMFAIAFVPALLLGIGMLFLSDMPRWLASKGRWEEAGRVLERVVGPAETEQELRDIQEALAEEQAASLADYLRELVGPGIRWALIGGVGLAIFQQVVGINTVIYYAPTIFQFVGFKSADGAILATSVVGVVMVLATVVAVGVVDSWGRRPLLLYGCVGMGLALVAVGFVFATGVNSQRAAFVMLLCLLLYIISFAIGWGPVFWIMTSELFPNRLRGTGASISTLANWSANLLVSITFLTLLNLAGKSAAFWIYASLSVLAFIFVWFVIPETKGKTLEQIETYYRRGRRWGATPSSERGLARQ
jgi:SP family galactose:H+ symporter-like MFS transporter